MAGVRWFGLPSCQHNALPTVNANTPAISAWTMMVVGFGGVGGALRYRGREKRRQIAAIAA